MRNIHAANTPQSAGPGPQKAVADNPHPGIPRSCGHRACAVDRPQGPGSRPITHSGARSFGKDESRGAGLCKKYPQAYAKSIHIENIVLSRAENFIHQEVTILDADAVNAGQQSVAGLAVTVEFFDDMHQVVLRETRGVLGTPPVVLTPGQKRSFSISFDRVPASWNLQQPSVRLTYLQLATVK